MSSTSLDRLDEPLYKAIGGSIKDGDIGFELELEGTLPHMEGVWSTKEEASLRKGLEYVLTKPISINVVDPALDMLYQKFREYKPKTSIRCSTHIHVNVGGLTVRQIYNALGLWYLLEDLLVATQSLNRQGNLFCLRMSDAEGIAIDILESIADRKYFGAFDQNNHKYGALNLAAMRMYASMEFRFLDATLDHSVASGWCKALYHIVHAGAQRSPTQWVELAETNPQLFLDIVLIDFLRKQVADLDKDLIYTNIDQVSRIGIALAKVKHYRLDYKTYISENDLGEYDNPLNLKGDLNFVQITGGGDVFPSDQQLYQADPDPEEYDDPDN